MLSPHSSAACWGGSAGPVTGAAPPLVRGGSSPEPRGLQHGDTEGTLRMGSAHGGEHLAVLWLSPGSGQSGAVLCRGVPPLPSHLLRLCPCHASSSGPLQGCQAQNCDDSPSRHTNGCKDKGHGRILGVELSNATCIAAWRWGSPVEGRFGTRSGVGGSPCVRSPRFGVLQPICSAPRPRGTALPCGHSWSSGGVKTFCAWEVRSVCASARMGLCWGCNLPLSPPF